MQPTFVAVKKFSVSKAHKTQLRLSRKIITEDRLPHEIKRVAGVDAAYIDELAIGAVAVLDYETHEILEQHTATCQAKFPYIPTLLSFREIPPAVACIKKLRRQPDVLLVDGQGAAHPYGCGFASHLGLVMGKPTVGVAKSKLVGDSKLIAGQELLVQNDQIIGAVVTTKEGVKPVYVSVGHLISLGTAVKIAKHCVRNSRIPEPILQAHKIAAEEKRKVERKRKTL
ncbi:endonuclease V [Candidatus Bathyarchaeota archaeon]|nr:endonuclease V [Candidatus Bathyarchaeota archaeon]